MRKLTQYEMSLSSEERSKKSNPTDEVIESKFKRDKKEAITDFRKQINRAKAMIDRGASEDAVIKKCGIAALNAANADAYLNEY